MTRYVEVKGASFPEANKNTHLKVAPLKKWQVLCGDSKHWRTGIYSPSASNINDIEELEKHSCPELFLLLEGELTLVLEENKKLVELKLQKGLPVLVDSFHSGYCPNGAHTGKAFIVERDEFITEYRAVKDLTS